VGVHNGYVVGASCAIIEEYWLNGSSVKIGWGHDLMLKKQFRGSGLGKAIQHTIMNEVPVYMAHAMAGSTRYIINKLNADAIIVLQEMIAYIGNEHKSLWQYLMARQSSGDKIHNKVFKKTLKYSHWIDGLNWKKHKKCSMRFADDGIIVEISRINEDVDIIGIVNDMVQYSSNTYVFFRDYDVHKFRWRFVEQPYKEYFVASISGACGRAVAIFRIGDHSEVNIILISDILYESVDEKHHEKILKRLISVFSEMNIDLCLMPVANSQNYRASYNASFRPGKKYETIVYSQDAILQKDIAENSKLGGLFSLSDQDLDRYPLVKIY
jgi:hypothetical protein